MTFCRRLLFFLTLIGCVGVVPEQQHELTETAREVRPWYCGETRLEPSAYMSILLD